MHAVTDQLCCRTGIIRRHNQPRLSVVDRLHCIEQVCDMAGSGKKGPHRRVIVSHCMSKRYRTELRRFPHKCNSAFGLRRHGYQADCPACCLVEPFEHLHIRNMDVLRILRAALLHADKRSLQMNADGTCAILRSSEMTDRPARLFQLRFLERHCCRAPARHAILRVEAAHCLHFRVVSVTGICAHRRVGVDVHQSGDDIKTAVVQNILCPLAPRSGPSVLLRAAGARILHG